VEVALIQEQRAERRHYDSAWTINLITGALLSLVLVGSLRRRRRFSRSREWNRDPVARFANMIRSFENIGVVDFRKNLEFHREFNFCSACAAYHRRHGDLAYLCAITRRWWRGPS
jgi:PST family polysaccharide transporter